MIFQNILPKSIIIKIYEYDSTYHDIYSVLKKELKLKTPFWRIKWLNKNNSDYDYYDGVPLYKYDSYKKQINSIVYFWNNYTTELPLPIPERLERSVVNQEQEVVNCLPEFITDENGKGSVYNILRHIKSLKGYIPKGDDKLYKPGKKSNIFICQE